MKLLKTLKSLKNLKKSKLAKAVAMSLILGGGVMGVCGNALAETVTKSNEIVNGDVIGFYFDGEKGDVGSNTVNIINKTVVNGNVAGGMSNAYWFTSAYFNTVNIENATVNGKVTGGFCRFGATDRNTVNLNRNSFVRDDVRAADNQQAARYNCVNVDSFVHVGGTVYGSNPRRISEVIGNHLDVHGILNEVGGISGFQNINIDILNWENERLFPCEMLKVKDSIDFDGLDTLNAQNSSNYKPGTTLTLLYSDKIDFTKLSKDKLRIDGEAKEEVAIDKSSLYDVKDIKAVDAVAGFDVLPNALKFVTKYKLNDTLNVIKQNVYLHNELQLNGQTINMQQSKDAAVSESPYDLLSVKKLKGEGNLAIDVDFGATLLDGTKTIKNDYIYINSDEANDAVINLSSVIVRRDLESTLSGFQEAKGEISVIKGNLNGITLKADSVKSATSKYIYVFTPGTDGKLNFTQMLAGTLADYIQDEGKFKGVNIFTQTLDEIAERNLGTTYRENGNQNITLAVNKGITISGDKKYEGITVAGGYTFNLKGEVSSNPGKMTQFKTAAVTVNEGGTLEVGNMTFEGNDKDIINNGTLKLTGTNTVTTLSGVGNTAVETGKTTISDFAQNDVTVNKGAELVVNNKATINGRIENNGKFNATGSSIEAMTNNGDFSAKDSSIVALTNNKTANMNGNNTLTSVSGTGNMNVYGETTVSGNFEQNNAYVDRNKSLTLNGNQNIINRLYVSLGSVDLTNTNSINDIRTLDTRSSKVSLNGTNNIGYIYLISAPGYGKEPLNLNGSNTIESINGRESDDVIRNAQIIIEGGKTTVTGSCKLTDVTVDAGKLTLNGYSFVKSSLNINKNGTLEIGDALRLTVAAINNNGIVTMNSTKNNTLPRVEGEGTFNVEQGKTTVNGIFNQKELNFTLPKDIKEDSAMLILKGAATDISLKDTDINTNVTGENYTHGTTVTLLSSKNAIAVSEEKLKINGETAKEATVETAVDGLSGAVGAIVGYEVSPQALKLTTNSYKLLMDTDVTKSFALNSELHLNGQTLNMQSDPEGTEPYNALTVNKLSGNGYLAIDVDLADDKNDQIIIMEANDATITLNSIIVRGDLEGLAAGTEKQIVDNKVFVITGKVNDNSLSVANDAIKTSTTDYIYTFTKGAAGKLNVTQEDAATIVDFIQGREKYNDDKILVYTLTKNVNVDEALGETKRDNSRELTVAFNKGVSLSGKTASGELIDGVTIADGYTLKLQGEDEATPGTMTQFKTAAIVEKEGTLEVADMKFVDNGKDIVNKGTLKLSGTNTINDITNDGTAELEGRNAVTTLHNNGVAKLNGADNQIETVVGNGTFNVTDGKTTVEHAFVQKTVNVSGGELELKAPKDSFLAGEVQGHAANITGGKVTGHAYGGLSVEDAHENNVNITNGTVDGDVYGGVSYNGNAYKNTVNISSGTVTGDVYGALAINNGTAYANTVNISGDDTLIKGNVYGGINEYGDNNTHHDNVINISGGTVGGTIYGASNKVEANNLLHVTGSNTKPIEVGNIAYLQKLEFTMPQGYDRRNALLTLTDQDATSLNLNGDKSVVLKSSPEDRLVTGDRVTLIQKTSDQALELKDNGNVIFNDDGTMKAAYNNIVLYQASPLYMLKGKLELHALDDGKANDLIFVAGKNAYDRDDEEVKPVPKPTPVDPDPDDRPAPDPTPIVPPGGDDRPEPIKPVDPVNPDKPVKPVKPEPQPTPEPEPQPIDYDMVYGELLDNVKTAMETRANGAALVNEAGDFLMKQGLSNAKMAAEANKAEGDSSMAPFVALGGGKLRYETGSHVDSKSWHGAVGLAKQVNGLTFGVAIQQGKSNYDAYVNKAHSEGNSKSVGGALFAEKKIANGLHFDAAVRGGRVKNDYNANVTYSFEGAEIYNVRFKESSAFYGISFGGGKEFTLKTKDKVDVYGRYAWTHTGSSEATTNWKDELKFDGINSHRILLGSRYTHAVNERNELYAGLGWQYELGGKVKGSVYGYSAPEPSLKGSSGLLELGWKAAAEENMTVDLNLSGWTGKQRGVMAGVNMQWKF